MSRKVDHPGVVLRYYLIDRVTELEPGQRIRGIKAITLTDEVLHDHFPDFPIMPGALIVEGAAQLAGFLLETTLNKPGVPIRRAILARIQDARFMDMAGPGDRLDFEVTVDSLLESAGRFNAMVTCEGRKIARCRVTLVLRPIDSEAVHAHRRYIYRIWTRGLANCPEFL